MSSSQRFASQFYKTELCKYHLRGQCTKGESCSHAHSPAELKSKPQLAKSRLCKETIRGVECTTEGCTFAHCMEELSVSNVFFRTKMCNYQFSGKCRHGSQCRYAHAQDELSSSVATPAGPATRVTENIAPEFTGSSVRAFAKPSMMKRVPMFADDDQEDQGYPMRKGLSNTSVSTSASVAVMAPCVADYSDGANVYLSYQRPQTAQTEPLKHQQVHSFSEYHAVPASNVQYTGAEQKSNVFYAPQIPSQNLEVDQGFYPMQQQSGPVYEAPVYEARQSYVDQQLYINPQQSYQPLQPYQSQHSYESQQSYPPQQFAHNGQVYTQDVTNQNCGMNGPGMAPMVAMSGSIGAPVFGGCQPQGTFCYYQPYSQ